ncbi:hypothetical protein ABRZ00_12975 [Castellaniella ginsengisoli]|uniref:Uncharacterized protein n=1 Tax=Castellaniella ginsengisoli TaxID=546114 RepID=A0AB39DJT0_9BURK
MTTKTEIKLPSLPQPRIMPQAQDTKIAYGYGIDDMDAYARAAVEADRQDHLRGAAKMMPSDDELLQLASEYCDSTDATGEEPRFTTDESILRFARAMLSRYSSGQPAASAEPVAQELTRSSISVSCPHCGAGPYYYCAHPFRNGGGAAPVAQEPVATDIDDLIERVLDAQQDINLEANMHMSQTLCNAAALLDDVETALRRYAAPVAAQAQPDVQTLIAYAEGRIKHVNEGECPDNIEGHDARDPDCPVCRALMGTIHAQPAMPPLTEAMRAVLRNENDVYGDEDALYAALCDAAQAQSSGISGELAEPSGNSGELASAQDRADAERYRWATALDDNSETLHSIVLSYGGDQAKVNERVDVYRACDDSAAKGDDHA